MIETFLDSFHSALTPESLRMLISLLLLVVALKIARIPVVKGWFGEKLVSLLFRLNLPKDQYRVYHDVTLPTENGTTQIDHIVVSPNGIFCVETKNMRGWIFGSERQAQWTQQIYKYKTRFQNPLRQNYKHTETLRELLDLPKEAVHSVVVFVGASTFQKDMPPNVTYCRGCTDYILEFKQPIFDAGQLQRVHQAIQSGRLEPTRSTRRQHVQYLRQRYTSTDGTGSDAVPRTTPNVSAADEPTSRMKELGIKHDDRILCPKCDVEMVLRTSRRGANQGKQFWGCSAFPKCRGTRKVNPSVS